ncbi:MAG TPA: sulfatase, partial [Thermogutta sp.]|nr:sulfatase [Thermogutta sp.]
MIFILLDDLGATDFGCTGSRFYETPHIDRLAAQGMRFTQGYAACTVCSPTRAAVMTGKYPARLHITDWIKGHVRPKAKLRIPDWTMYLPLEEVTIAERLRLAGYATAHVGKWHLGDPPYYPEHQGFDINIGGTHMGAPGSYFWPYGKDDRRVPLDGGQEGEYLTDRLTDEAIRFIEQHKDRPFFLYFAHYAVHTPLQAKPELVAYYEKKLAEAAAKGDNFDGQQCPVYAAMIHSVDENMGRLLECLDRLDLAERTVIFLTSDNGGLVLPACQNRPVTHNIGIRAGKGSAYEGGVRVPWIVRWPGVVAPGSL